MSTLALALIALAALCGLFALLYFVAKRLDNYGIVDVAWSYAFAPTAAFYAFAGAGWGPRRAVLAAFVTFWSLRLGTHLLRRVASHHPVEDGRYVQLRRDWAGVFAPKMFGFFQLQAGSIVLLSLPFLLPMANTAPAFAALEWLGLALWCVALGGEALADAQLAAFKRDPANKGRVCERGLWAWSRHPNYLGEWLVWVGFLLMSYNEAYRGVPGLLCVGVIYYFLTRVTGIPLTEQQLLTSKGPAYADYQERVPAFWPRRPRR